MQTVGGRRIMVLYQNKLKYWENKISTIDFCGKKIKGGSELKAKFSIVTS